ncbi:MAG TPA: tRNA preQ1(34) S-adenosylmethionine ribosyltransferase-isomerase QueA [Terriglobales bacterium]|nr:tRNA preQ1(34) S-adenosylmethionine ribosyltransferase-isomerase QueA [Terriglobales bacterium]
MEERSKADNFCPVFPIICHVSESPLNQPLLSLRGSDTTYVVGRKKIGQGFSAKNLLIFATVLVSDFNYDLPDELIAQEPLRDRAASRLLHLRRGSDQVQDLTFNDFPRLLRQDDLLVFNNTRVFPARLYGRRSGARAQAVSSQNPAAKNFLKGQVEVLLTSQISEQPNEWECLVHPGRKIGVGERLFFGVHDELRAEVVARGTFGVRRIRFAPVDDFWALVEQIGHVPLPPYITRSDRPTDRDRYQTVYARERGSVAAPTAGLHFTPEVLNAIRERGIQLAEVTLHVGLGTFQPIRTEQVEAHRLHSERYTIAPAAAASINGALEAGRRVVAVGTTTIRTLEFSARHDGRVRAESGEADLFIYPGYQFRVVGALLTNFHLPQSTLLMLVSAFAGRERTLVAYRHAVEHKYRFYSYGDCMFVE